MRYEVHGVIEIRVTIEVEAETERQAESEAEYQLEGFSLQPAPAVRKQTVWVEEVKEVSDA